MLRTTLLYLVLVGVPLSGLLGILRWGESLAAPPALGAQWTLEGDGLRCLGVETGAILAIIQSGRYLRLELGERSFEARLDGDGLRGQLPPPRSGPCTNERLELQARTTRDLDLLEGRLVGACPPCTDLDVVAVRTLP